MKYPGFPAFGLAYSFLQMLFLRLALVGGIATVAQAGSPAEHADMLRQQWAEQIGTLAYVYGYPLVDMQKQMHNETHRLGKEQQVAAPVNRFYRFTELATPENQGNLRAPNNDTLYFSGWFDLSEPVVVRVPATGDRYYTLAVTDLYSEVQHISRRNYGGEGGEYVLVGPDWKGTLPAELIAIRVATGKAWILGRMLVADAADLPAARQLVERVQASSLGEWRSGETPAAKTLPAGEALQPLDSLEFFVLMNRALRQNPIRPGEEALMAQFDQIGVGPSAVFDPGSLDPASRQGLERALERGQQLVRLSASQAMTARNGWIFLPDAGRYGADYLRRAAVVLGGYANLPEESVYPATLVDSQGGRLDGAHSYRLHFPADALPPVGAFWSLSLYDDNRSLAANPIDRYSIGDRSSQLQYNPDGSLTLYLQHAEPAPDKRTNWLPAPPGPFMAVLRLYEPDSAVLSGAWAPPSLRRAP